jgi:hypothetical protein
VKEGKAYGSTVDRQAEAVSKANKEIAKLGVELANLKNAHDAGYKSAGDQARGELDLAEKAEVAAKKTKDAAQKLAEYQLGLSQRLATERAALKVEEASTVADRMKAINEQEAGILEDQIRAALKAGASDKSIQEMRYLSHHKTLLRIRAEETKWAKDRDKMIEDGIAKNKEEAAAKIAEIEKVKAVEKAESDAKKAQIQQGLDMAAASLQAASMIFGKNKSLAIASAIMDTLAAANKAMIGPPPVPWSLPFVALALATGYKNVQAIKSAGSEGGFDDPVNDLLARDYGRRWASDFSREVGKGFAGGLRASSGRAGSVVNQNTNIDRGTHIGTANFNGLLGTPSQAMLGLQRRLIRTTRVENRTRRRSTS